MARPKAKREIATKNIRIYPSTLSALQLQSTVTGKTIARLLYEVFGEVVTGAKADSGAPHRIHNLYPYSTFFGRGRGGGKSDTLKRREVLRKKLLG